MFIVSGGSILTTALIRSLVAGAIIALGLTVIAAGAASVFGSAGTWVYKGGLFISGVTIFYTIMDALGAMLPSDTPPVVSMILILPPIAGLCWVIIDKIILKAESG